MLELVATLDAHEKYGLPFAFVDEGETLLTGGFDGSLAAWTTPEGRHVASAAGHDRSVNCGAVTSDGRLATGSTDTSVRLWTVPDLDPDGTLEGHTDTVAGLATHPDEPIVCSASYDTTVRSWDAGSGQSRRVYEGHPRNVTVVAFLADGETIVSGGLGGEALVWDLDGDEPIATLSGHGDAVVGIDRTPEGAVATVGYDGVVRFWDTTDWRERRTVALPADATPSGIAVAADDGRAAVTRDGGVVLLDADGATLAEASVGIKGVSMPRWSPDGTRLAVGGADGRIRLFE